MDVKVMSNYNFNLTYVTINIADFYLVTMKTAKFT
jgi:hypothetical protein